MQELKITVITPSYNQADYLEATMASVLSQNYPHLEYLVFDGGSKDSSASIIEKHASQLTYWESKKDKGQSDAINKGMQRATGDIVAYLNSDDLYVEDTFAYVNDFFTQHPDVDVLVGKTQFVDEQGVPTEGFADLFEKELNEETMYSACYIPQPSVFFRSKVISKAGVFDQTLHYCFDYEYWLRLYTEGYRFQKVEKVLSLFRLQPSSKTNTAYTTGEFDKEFLRIFKMYYSKVTTEKRKKTLVEAYALFTRLFYLHIESTWGVGKAKKEALKKIMEFTPCLKSKNIFKLLLWFVLPNFVRSSYVKRQTNNLT